MRVDSNFLSNDFIKPLSSNDEKKENVNLFSNLLNSVSNQENAVNQMKTEFINGERDDIDNILLEGQKFNLQLNFALEVRNNLVDMFKQMSNMQI